MGRVQDAVTAALAAEVSSRTEWDERPGLYFIRYSGGECSLRRFPLPDAIWASGPPAEILAAIADGLGLFGAPLRAATPPDLHDAAFYCEVWMATARHGTAEADDLLGRARAAGGKVSQLADRVEARNLHAVDRAGITYAAIRQRGGGVQTGVSYPKAAVPFTGAIPRALDKLVTALLAVDLPERPRASW
jgi:hypothetical protein